MSSKDIGTPHSQLNALPSDDVNPKPLPSSPEDSESGDDQKVVPSGAAHRRRIQNAQFEALLSEHALNGSSKGAKLGQSDRPDHDLPITLLLAKQECNGGNLDPREYQIELFERAKARNTIAVLDTGSGKTLIAVLLLKHILNLELIDRDHEKAPRVAFFLVDSVTLVFQQAAVLRNNLDQNVAHIFGSMGPDFWDSETWKDLLNRHMVIVCTAEILNHALLNGFVQMSQINLLIFDEAHHTKKNHVYARIIRESYLPTDKSERPRIFGMTASPIDAKANIADAAVQLETYLDSEIAMTSHLTSLRQAVRRPKEEAWVYPKLDSPFPTELYVEMERRFGNVKALKPILRFALNATSDLGRWCTDQVWEQALADDVLPKLEGILSKEAYPESLKQSQAETQQDIIQVKDACNIVRSRQFKHPSEAGQLSPKVELFVKRLRELFATSNERKCIVFTQRRNTAKTLFRLCEKLEIPNLHPGVLVGVTHDLTGNTTFRHQFLILAKFRQGEINCLFATSVAEEGLDIPDCNLVVRFDLYNTLIQYIQSRGRARHANSIYATMIEMGNDDHKGRLQEVREAESLMQAFCRSLPEDRLVNGNDHDLDVVLKKEEKTRIYTIPSTGAKLTYGHAINVLERYASSLRYESDISAAVNYVMFSQAQSFVCEIVLPEKSPIRGLIGSPASRKGLAKQSAAFDACILLRKNNLLDANLRSVYQKRLPAMRNAKLAIVSKKTNEYIMICKPSIWNQEEETIPEMLFGMLIKFIPSKPLKREHQSLLLLSRRRLPPFPSFPIFLDNDVCTLIQTVDIGSPFSVTSQELIQLSNFTLAVFLDVFHKSFDPVPEKFPYWLAPVRADAANDVPKGVVDWETVAFVQDHMGWQWSPDMDIDFLLSRFIYDPWDGRRRYFPIAVDPNLRASDPPPDWTPRRKWMQDIINYSLSLSKNSRPKILDRCDWNQPVLQVECLCLRRNFLDKATNSEKLEATECVVCPQPLVISAIPLTTVTSCLAFPAIISRLESYMIVMEGCRFLGLEIETELALEAFTKDSDNTEEHRAMQLHVQRGMGKNYERLEFLGDCFLKMGTTISLFAQRPDDDEYDYHVHRMCLICNQNLFNTATKVRLYEYIRSRSFSRHTWYPPGLTLLHGRNYVKHIASESSHNLGEKTIADVCEALIAAALLTGGKDQRFDSAVRAVTLFVDNGNHTATCWADYLASYSKPAYQVQASDGAERDLANKVLEKLGYRFNFPRLLRSAFTHPSYPSVYAKVPCYQRLEFLGDALLDLACVEYLFHRYPDKDPQWLTEHKMAMVSNKFLGALAVKLGLHRHLQYFGGPLQGLITHYAEDIQIAEGESGGAMDYWLGTRDSPKCLPDMLEAYLGAIFVDSGFDFTVVEAFFTPHVRPFFEDMSLYDTFANKHPTTYLHNQLTNVYGCTNYCLKAGEIPEIDGVKPEILAAVMVHGQSVANAVGTSGRYAKVRASERALVAIQGMLVSDFRLKYHCDCGPVDEKVLAEMDIGTAV